MRQLNYHRNTLKMHRFTSVGLVLCLVATFAGCRGKEAGTPLMATPTVTLSHAKAPIGSPLDITYKFVVAADAHFDQDYRVMLHVLDADEELMWTDDHNPPTPTSQWKPGQTVEYTRTVFIPVYPFVGQAKMQLGLYSTKTQQRLTLGGDDAGQHSYRVGQIQLQPQTENVFTVFKDGWYPTEGVQSNPAVEWQWTKKQATLAFKNPKKDVVLYLDLDNPGGVFKETQQVQVSAGGTSVDQFALEPAHPLLRKVAVTAAQLGSADMAEVVISVDKTFVPATLSGGTSTDPRELGVRVFHAFVDAR